MLELRSDGDDWFAGPASQSQSGTRIFGGLVLAQALVAAGRTVGPGLAVNSLYAGFLRPGQAAESLRYAVERLRDGRSFCSRAIQATQHGSVLLRMEASFHAGENAVSHQLSTPVVPAPDTLAPPESWFDGAGQDPAQWAQAFLASHPVDVRFLSEPPPLAVRRGPQPPCLGVWLRCRGPLGDDQLLHAAALAYASDLFLLSAALLPHGEALAGVGAFAGTTLGHAIWFHEAFRADDWLYFEQVSPWTGHGRTISQGQVFDRSGVLVATVAQEGLLRRRAAAARAPKRPRAETL